MRMKFTGKYTGGRTSITLEGVTFEGRDSAEVPEGSRLIGHPEFEEVKPGRPKKTDDAG